MFPCALSAPNAALSRGRLAPAGKMKTGVHRGFTGKIVGATALVLLLTGCGGAPRAPSMGEAFVGPATLKIRSDIPLESSTVATARHGDRLEILQRRRRFLRVRTSGGVEGWTDERQLLGAEEMAALKDLSDRAARMPAQGQATSFGELNVHTQPDRQSPSFLQIKEKEKVDVLAHVTAPRKETPRKPLLPPPPKKAKAARKTPPKEPTYPPPLPPKPPGPPANWLDLSNTDLGREDPGDEELDPQSPLRPTSPSPPKTGA